jgi:hypothetical protein
MSDTDGKDLENEVSKFHSAIDEKDQEVTRQAEENIRRILEDARPQTPKSIEETNNGG